MMAEPATLTWFARHELSLFWRDWIGMMTAGRRTRGVVLVIVLLAAAVLLHLLANALVGPWAATGIHLDKPTLVLLTGGGLLFWSVMLSQTLESVTRAYYARSDLDLILSSPASARRLFAVRTAAIALMTMLLSALLAAPAIDMLAWHDGPRWLCAYGVLAAFSALATAVGIGITIALFHFVGARQTRLIAQIVAAVIGAGFIIGIQAAAILGYGTLDRFAPLQSGVLIALAPGIESPLWWPARAAMGDLGALAAVMVLGLGALAVAVLVSATSFSHHAVAAAGISQTRVRQAAAAAFRPATQKQALRRKEWTLLRRDPWLLSQTLMQVLYLLPPALLLWMNFGRSAGAAIVVVPVIVMAAGQLAGGLAWLALSGEDAHDLVVTAPVAARTVLAAKIESITAVIAAIVAPLLVLTALLSPRAALATALGVVLSTASATAIQMWFRAQARRSMFRRRQISSRAATLCEAFASIMWAGAAAILASGDLWPLAIGPAVLALLVLLLAWSIRPRSAAGR
jgi:ABC-2 type transport system permease protein